MHSRQSRTSRLTRSSRAAAAALAAVLAVGAAAGCSTSSTPRAAAVTPAGAGTSAPPTTPAPPKLTPQWPAGGQAALLVDGLGISEANGPVTPVPIASVTKVMTAYAFLKAQPLAADASGPTYTISAEEAAAYGTRVARFESLAKVTAGEKFTQRRALEALMVVSANNIAHEIARWVDGGDAKFVERMNGIARELGMKDTTYTDPSGFDPTTRSTAADQAKLFAAAMKDPAFRQIVATASIKEPGTPEPRPNGNTLLGKDGVIGGKTGFTTPAGANLVFAAEREIEGVRRLVIAAVINQRPAEGTTAEGVTPALESARALITSIGTADAPAPTR
ncbi:D-alanyl-D-alanine carboxypeptidase family protein [Yinghuangia soli]|uniref:Serine hydrolase n=1 Tax=Yinghuangia soli TaxID=2908204 RepID=A0AA41U0E3_9ACTN|nr:serine hydrolase [Yinghuangia soli]MCF2528330.1 serine hydrolase [Yinghuangia soli]